MTDSSQHGERTRPLSEPMSVPVFNLVVYVQHGDGSVRARVANLPDLESVAAGEPLALRQVIELAKRRLSAWQAAGEPIPWVTRPSPPLGEETERFVAVHL